MSTKIYNGYCLPLMGTLELMAFLNKVKNKIVPIHDELWNNVLAKQATALIDFSALGDYKAVKEAIRDKDAVSFRPKWEAYEGIRNRIKKINETKLRDPEIDFGFSVCLIPTKSKILALLYTEKEKMKKAWESFKCVKPYYYYNNSDRPDEITALEWKKRGTEWEQALGKDGIPGNKSLQYNPISDFSPFPGYDDIKTYVPSFSERVNSYTSDNAFEEYCKSPDEKIQEKVKDRHFVSLIYMFEDYKKTPEGKKLIEKHATQIKSKLKKKLGKNDFVNEIKLCQ